MLTLDLELNQDMLICPLRQDQLLLGLVLVRCLCYLPPCLTPLQAAGDLLCARDQIAWTCTAPMRQEQPSDQHQKFLRKNNRGRPNQNPTPEKQNRIKSTAQRARGGEGLLSHRFAVPGLKDP